MYFKLVTETATLPSGINMSYKMCTKVRIKFKKINTFPQLWYFCSATLPSGISISYKMYTKVRIKFQKINTFPLL